MNEWGGITLCILQYKKELTSNRNKRASYKKKQFARARSTGQNDRVKRKNVLEPKRNKKRLKKRK